MSSVDKYRDADLPSEAQFRGSGRVTANPEVAPKRRHFRVGDNPLMTNEEGSIQLADAAWTLRGAPQSLIPLTSLTQAGLVGQMAQLAHRRNTFHIEVDISSTWLQQARSLHSLNGMSPHSRSSGQMNPWVAGS